MAWRVMLHCLARSIGRRPSGPGYRNTPSSVALISKPFWLSDARSRATRASRGNGEREPIIGVTDRRLGVRWAVRVGFDIAVKVLYIAQAYKIFTTGVCHEC